MHLASRKSRVSLFYISKVLRPRVWSPDSHPGDWRINSPTRDVSDSCSLSLQIRTVFRRFARCHPARASDTPHKTNSTTHTILCRCIFSCVNSNFQFTRLCHQWNIIYEWLPRPRWSTRSYRGKRSGWACRSGWKTRSSWKPWV